MLLTTGGVPLVAAELVTKDSSLTTGCIIELDSKGVSLATEGVSPRGSVELTVVGDTGTLAKSVVETGGVTAGLCVVSRNLICAMCSSSVDCSSADSITSDSSSDSSVIRGIIFASKSSRVSFLRCNYSM